MMTLLFSPTGRMNRRRFVLCMVLLFSSLLNGYWVIDHLGPARPMLSLLFAAGWLYVFGAVCAKRMRDTQRSPWWLLLVLIPLAGPVLLALWMLLRWTPSEDSVHVENEHFRSGQGKTVINDVTQLNPVTVKDIFVPTGPAELAEFLRSSQDPCCIGGGRFSMGGQTSSPDTVLLDMRRMNQVLEINAAEKTVRVQPGARWCDIQRAVDSHDLSIQVMQTYANFTVGGSLSVNCHGRYIGLGPLILSVRSLKLMLADGSEHFASPEENSQFFYGAIGCYGALGVVTEVTLQLADNVPMVRSAVKLDRDQYLTYFRENVRNNPEAIFHNADLYPPHYGRCLAVTWSRTDLPHRRSERIQVPKTTYPVHRYFYWAVTETPLGKWRREHLFDPAFYRKALIYWRNFEAGYCVGELEPDSRKHKTYVLQEYFVPLERFDEFAVKMRDILARHKANVVNVSVRHAFADPGSLLAWASEEVFAFVLYYKQGTSAAARAKVGEWTVELVEASIQCGGRYYLPYQPWASSEQFHRAYPRAEELFALKRQYDPNYRFRNSLWDKYYPRSQNV
jgi:FAD/FMN-containing dehydrogenase/uncharacterized membrane protein YhaH (DUF805 family)